MTGDRFPYLGADWIDAAREILTSLAAERGEPAHSFRLCERFANAPREVAPSGVAAWHFSIDGTSASVGAGELTDVDLLVTGDYQDALEAMRQPLTAEQVSAPVPAPPAGGPKRFEGSFSKAPPYLAELHVRLARMTA